MPDCAIALEGKPDLIVHPDAAINAETPPHLLDEPITPVARFFVRNNGHVPRADLSAEGWRLTVDGAVHRPLLLSPRQLEREFDVVGVTSVLECAGNGRVHFEGTTDGVPWGLGAVGCARFTGVRLADVLHRAGLREGARYVAHESPDEAATGTGAALSRGLPLWKALGTETLIAFAMNGRPLELLHGAPLRIVAPGFPGSAWQKWLSRLWVRECEHDGEKMTGYDYRLPTRPLRVGERPSADEMAVIEDVLVNSLITSPGEGAALALGNAAEIRGFAWSGHVPLARVDVSADGGATWEAAALEPAEDRFAWARFRLPWRPARRGRTLLVSRAFDAHGQAQPLDAAPWNPKGYCNNRVQRLALEIV